MFGRHWTIDGDDFYLLGLIWTMGFGHVCLDIILGRRLFVFRVSILLFAFFCTSAGSSTPVHVCSTYGHAYEARACLSTPAAASAQFCYYESYSCFIEM